MALFTEIKKLIHDVLTENDGQSYCIGRVIIAFLATSGFPTFLGCALYSVYANPEHHFDQQSFGIAFGAILAGLSTAVISIGQKQKTDK